MIVRVALEIDTDDAWNLYNLMNIGDLVKGSAYRKIQKESYSGLVQNIKRKFDCVLRVESFEFDPEADAIRITGINAQENKYLKLGQYQSIEIQAPKTLTLIKTNFDIVHHKKLNDAVEMHNLGHVCVIVMEEGIAHLFLVGKNTSKLKAKIEKSISKKKAFAQQHDKQKNKFFEQVLQALIQHFVQGAKNLKSIVVGSPGFVKEAFYEYMKQESQKQHNVFLKQCLDRIILTHTSSGFKHSLQEVINSRTVQDQINNLSVFSESVTLEKFFEILSLDPDRCCYGQRSVDFAMKAQAVETLLISDKLFRAKNVATRKLYVGMVEEAERNGLKNIIFSSMNPSGDRLNNLSGVAAILRYPLQGLDDIDEEDIDLDDLIEQEGDQQEEKKEEDATKKLSWDEQQLELLLQEVGDEGDGEEDEEDDS
eukprot:403361845